MLGAPPSATAAPLVGAAASVDLGRKRPQFVVLAAAPPHVGHALDDERLYVRKPVWRSLKKPLRKVQAQLELLVVVVAALEEAVHHHVLVVAVPRVRRKVLEVLLVKKPCH